MCYALGALELFDGIYDIQEVKMTIFQPRRENVSTYTLSKDDLLQWADEILVPAAQLAFKGEGNINVVSGAVSARLRTVAVLVPNRILNCLSTSSRNRNCSKMMKLRKFSKRSMT